MKGEFKKELSGKYDLKNTPRDANDGIQKTTRFIPVSRFWTIPDFSILANFSFSFYGFNERPHGQKGFAT